MPLAFKVRFGKHLIAGLAATVSIAVGAAITAGRFPMEMTAAMIVGFAMALILVQLRAWAVPVWIAVGPLAYPFVRYPTGHPLITFDRVWLLGILAWLVTEQPARSVSRRTRLLLLTGGWLVVAIGLRS